MNECVGRARVKTPQGETVRLPIAYLICNQQPPTGDRPSLMSFDEMSTLLHEFGHVSQHIFTTVEESSVAGIRGVEWDAVELASQFLENFTYDESTLQSLSSHVDTGAPLPKEVYDALLRSRNYRAGSALLRQVHFSTLDQKLHAGVLEGLPARPYEKEVTTQQLSQLTSAIGSLERNLAPRTSGMPFDPASRFLNSFSHIFAGGYSAGYYSYKWAETMSADAFGAFEEAVADKPSKEEASKRWSELGKKYRDSVLALGGSVPAAEVFRMFRGRDPSTEALLRQAGLAKPARA